MKKMFLMYPLLLMLATAPAGCSWIYGDDPAENYWEEAEKDSGTSPGNSGKIQEKIEELSKGVEDSKTKVTILEDEVGDIQKRIEKEKGEIDGLRSKMKGYDSGGAPSSEEKKEMERQIRILENDVKWLKWIQKNY